MRDIGFYVADISMENAISGFLSRPDFHLPHNLGTRKFQFDAREDMLRAGGHDPGLYSIGHDLIQIFRTSHEKVVVILDAEWQGAPPPQVIQQQLSERILKTGWTPDRFKVIVIDPELEAWIWQRNQRVAKQLKFNSVAEMVGVVVSTGIAWPDEAPKPARPKEALEAIARNRRIGWSSAIHRSITENVTLVGCQDPSFIELRDTLQAWFPPSATAS
ncbi:methylation-associated defense system protein MAD4 [Pirellulaceae bacterium SH467]